MNAVARRRWLSAFTVASIVVAVAIVLGLRVLGSSAQAGEVELISENQRIGTMSEEDALREASEAAGFAVRTPTGAAADDLVLRAISVRTFPPADLRDGGQPPISASATLSYARAGSEDDAIAFEVEQFSLPPNVKPVGRWSSSPVELGATSATVWEHLEEQRVVIIAIRWGAEGFNVTADASLKDEAIDLARAVVDSYDQ